MAEGSGIVSPDPCCTVELAPTSLGLVKMGLTLSEEVRPLWSTLIKESTVIPVDGSSEAEQVPMMDNKAAMVRAVLNFMSISRMNTPCRDIVNDHVDSHVDHVPSMWTFFQFKINKLSHSIQFITLNKTAFIYQVTIDWKYG